MALRDFASVPYMPLLSLRPSEMRALHELPNRTKDLLLPVVHLRPWSSAHYLISAINKIEESYGSRPIVIGLGYPEANKGRRPVHDELDELRTPSGGYESWCEFIEEHENYIPAIQLGSVRDEIEQIECFYNLDRGLVVVVELPGFGALQPLARRVAEATDGGEDVCFVLDYQRVSQDHLQRGAATAAMIGTIRSEAPEAFVSISASSFPDSFVNVPDQPIYERRLYDTVVQAVPDRLIYSDHGSARAERQQAGGGTPSPRIDYPLRRDWKFYRSDDTAGFPGYRQQARLLMANPNVWNSNLRVWGTQMIERTAAGDSSAISNPSRSTAARINIHLQVQSFYDDPAGAIDTDEEWED
jgi:hypothetical protein